MTRGSVYGSPELADVLLQSLTVGCDTGLNVRFPELADVLLQSLTVGCDTGLNVRFPGAG